MDNNEPMWYVVQTYTGYESIVEENLHKMIENYNLQDHIFDVKVPVMDEVVEKNGKKKFVQKKKFQGYVFIKMIYTNHVWYMVTQRTRGVTRFAGPRGERPVPLTADEVKRMGLETIDIKDLDIKAGDHVRIMSGALEGFIGVVESISVERQKVKVVVSMFGRQTPVELDFSQVDYLASAD